MPVDVDSALTTATSSCLDSFFVVSLDDAYCDTNARCLRQMRKWGSCPLAAWLRLQPLRVKLLKAEPVGPKRLSFTPANIRNVVVSQ